LLLLREIVEALSNIRLALETARNSQA